MGNNSQSDRLTAINILHEERKLLLSYMYRREIAAWAAILSYLAILGFFTQSISSNSASIAIKIFQTIFALSVFIIFFGFIHSQYALIHQVVARGEALLKIMTKLYRDKSFDLSKFVLSDSDGTPNCIWEEQKKALIKVQPYRGDWHPLRIICDFALLKWARRSDKARKNVMGRTTQEAAIYWILLTLLFIVTLNIWSNYVLCLINLLYKQILY